MITGNYRHIRTGALYSVLNTCKTKFGGEWFDGVMYVSIPENGEVFVRTQKQFNEKFEKV
jgi:hypothetical protein